MFDSEIPRRLSRTERRLMKKRGDNPPKVLRDGLPPVPPSPPDPYVLTEEERLAVARPFRQQLEQGVDGEGNPWARESEIGWSA